MSGHTWHCVDRNDWLLLPVSIGDGGTNSEELNIVLTLIGAATYASIEESAEATGG